LKKSIAIAAASALGLASATIGALPANAAEVTTPCTTFQDHEPVSPLGDNWYMGCVPKFGVGKAEFSIDSSTDFPVGFKPLTDASVKVTSNVPLGTTANPGTKAYFSIPPNTETAPGILHLAKDDANSTSKKQSYTGNMIYRVASVESIDPTTLPAACFPDNTTTYLQAYKVTYLPTTVTFKETSAGKHWTFTVTSAPAPLYLGLGLLDNGVSGINLVEGSAQCASDGTNTLQSVYDSANLDVNTILIILPHATFLANGSSIVATLSPFPIFDANNTNNVGVGDLGAATVAKTDVATLQLAKTGVAPANGGGLAALLFSFGAVGLAISRRLASRSRRRARA
jgi:hypothetical protein